MWKVYKRTCPNGKVYIGVTSRTLEERMKGGYQNNRAFALAIIQYGKENIVSEILEEHESYDAAIERERFYILQYSDICYNTVGNRPRVRAQTSVHSSSTKTGAQCHAQNQAQRNLHKQHIVPLTPRPQGRHTVPVSVYDLNGNYIYTYPNSKIAAEETGVNKGDVVSCCKGVKSDGKPRYQCKGFIFRYAIDKLDEYPDIPVACKKVDQYTLDGEYICTFDSLKEAWLHTGATIGAIGKVCKGLLKSSGGFIWKYAEVG
jgi:predicted GIY-YIG superfamily endonuclease